LLKFLSFAVPKYNDMVVLKDIGSVLKEVSIATHEENCIESDDTKSPCALSLAK